MSGFSSHQTELKVKHTLAKWRHANSVPAARSSSDITNFAFWRYVFKNVTLFFIARESHRPFEPGKHGAGADERHSCQRKSPARQGCRELRSRTRQSAKEKRRRPAGTGPDTPSAQRDLTSSSAFSVQHLALLN